MQAQPGSGGVGFRRLAPHGLSALLDEDSDSSEERLILGIPAPSELNTPGEGVNFGTKTTTEPASSKYAAWLVKDIRKECTHRGLGLKSSMRKEERVEALERYDAAIAAYGEILAGDGVQAVPRRGLPARGDEIRSKHSMFRLLNILFCDEFALRFCDAATRSELDGKLLNERSEFWLDVRATFGEECPDDHERDLLEFHDDIFFSRIDPKMAKKEHTAKKLLSMWKEVNKNCVSAEAKFFSSGQNENDFRNFVNGCGDVLYLHKWLKKKPGMTNFVKGGLLAEDEFDTLEQTAASNEEQKAAATVTPSQRKPHEALESMASSFKAYVMGRRDEASRGYNSSNLQQRSQIIRMMADIRNQIAGVDKMLAQCEAAGSVEVQMLKEDRSILMEERHKLIKQLRETDK